MTQQRRSSGVSDPGGFATTHWSMIVSAGDNASTSTSRAALESLCQIYWVPLYAYVRRRVTDVSEAHDLTQAFFTELLEKNFVGSADPDRGRFRAFLLTAFKNFLSKEWAKSKAKKRGGGKSQLSLDFAHEDSRYKLEPTSERTADQVYERQWAITLLNRAMSRLEQELCSDGKQRDFELLKGFIIGEQGSGTYAEVAAQLETTEGAAKMAASRMRRRYRTLLRDEISQTVSSPSEIDDEIKNLFTILAS